MSLPSYRYLRDVLLTHLKDHPDSAITINTTDGKTRTGTVEQVGMDYVTLRYIYRNPNYPTVPARQAHIVLSCITAAYPQIDLPDRQIDR